jgi:hypothetical protein
MREKLRNALNAGLSSIVEMLVAMPVLLFIHLYILPEPLFWGWLVSHAVLYAVGCLLRSLWPNPRLIAHQLLLIAISGIFAWLWFGLSWPGIISLLTGWAALARGGVLAFLPLRKALRTNVYLLSVAAYFLLSFVSRHASDMQRIAPAVGWCAIGTLAITLYMLNRNALDQESLQEGNRPVVARSVLWKNRTLLVLFAVLVVLVANIQQLLQAFRAMIRKLGEWIYWLMSLGTGGEPPETATETAPPEMPFGEAGEPAAFWVILEKIVMWIAIIVGAIGALYLLYRLCKLAINGIKALYAWIMNRLMAGESVSMRDQDYEDEVEKLADWSDLAQRWRDRLHAMFEREPRDRWDRLTSNLERIRYLYRQALRRVILEGYRYEASQTPRELKKGVERWKGQELMPEELVRYYEDARYGGKELSDQQIEAVRKSVEERS